MTTIAESRGSRRAEGAPGDDRAAAIRVLQREAEAILALAEALDETFDRAVALIAGVKDGEGRVIVSGMGKSGHIARKIAATLASTGTPAHFVHPGEASHGDLGMITRRDAVLALSNSGETTELADIVAYCKRFAIPLVSITRNPRSTLVEAADVAIVLPGIAEACPHGLAPTTSTTMMMALGDALAVALLEREGFTTERFRDLHPGGKLGRRLLKVGDVMHGGAEVPLAPPSATMAEAILVMSEKTFGVVGVVEDGALVGIITDGDLRRHMGPDLLSQRAGQIMNRNPKTVRASLLAAEALALMNQNKIHCLFVLDGRRPIGLVRMHDILKAGVA